MRIVEIEKVVREGFSSEELKARILAEGPVALSDVLQEIEARNAARALGGRAMQVESELVVQRAANTWT